jgi:hypothetical protein
MATNVGKEGGPSLRDTQPASHSDVTRSAARLLRLAPEDNICVVTATVEPGEVVEFEGRQIRFADRIPTGHKVAVVAIAKGQRIRKYGVPIGSATEEIQPGQYVHTHNLKSDYLPTYTLDEGHGYNES